MLRKIFFTTLCVITGFVAGFAQGAPLKDFSAETSVQSRTRLWTEPTRYGEAMAILEKGIELQVLSYSTSKSWVKVRTPGGRDGWVPVRYTALSSKKRLLDSEEVAGEGDEEESPARGSRKLASAEESHPKLGLYGEGRGEYANQVSIGGAQGYGLGVALGYALTPNWAVGLSAGWNAFSDTALGLAAAYERKANHFLIGPLVRYQRTVFSIDAVVGYDIMNTTLSIIGGPNASVQSFSESAIGFSLRPAYRFPLGASTVMEAYVAYAIGFYSGPSLVPTSSGSKPQQLSLGVAVHFTL